MCDHTRSKPVAAGDVQKRSLHEFRDVPRYGFQYPHTEDREDDGIPVPELEIRIQMAAA